MIEFSTVLDLIGRLRSSGVPLLVEEKSGWLKVSGPGGDRGRRVYVAKRDTVRRVDVSGFGAGVPGTTPPPRPNGAVQALLDMDGDDPLTVLERLLRSVGSGAAPTVAPKVEATAPTKARTPRPAAAPKERVSPNERLERAAKIKGDRIAAELETKRNAATWTAR